MTDDATRLRETLAYYGSDVRQWPEEAKALGRRALERPDLAALIEKERRFEQRLLARSVPAPPQDLSQRIIAAAFARERASVPMGWFREFLAEVRPAALAAMLVLGFAIGFGMVAGSAQTRGTAFAQSPVDDEGAIL
jgi:hypothetical protein